MAGLAAVSVRTCAILSHKKARHRAAACHGINGGQSRVLTCPGYGAFAMIMTAMCAMREYLHATWASTTSPVKYWDIHFVQTLLAFPLGGGRAALNEAALRRRSRGERVGWGR